MTTAQATTNAIGLSISNQGDMGDNLCKTDQFKIETNNGDSSMFLDSDLYTPYLVDGREVSLGVFEDELSAKEAVDNYCKSVAVDG
jgi:hypothetical protein